jgi:hypothetical protein
MFSASSAAKSYVCLFQNIQSPEPAFLVRIPRLHGLFMEERYFIMGWLFLLHRNARPGYIQHPQDYPALMV